MYKNWTEWESEVQNCLYRSSTRINFGTFAFLLYIYDLLSLKLDKNIVSYADDTVIHCYDCSCDLVIKNLKNSLEKVSMAIIKPVITES